MAYLIRTPITQSVQDPSLAGHLEELAIDAQGRTFRLGQLSSDLTGDAFSDGKVGYRTSTLGLVSNDPVDAIAINTLPMPFGIACGALDESSASIASYGWFLIRGYKSNVVTDGTDDIAAGNMVTTSLNIGSIKKFSGTLTADLEGVKVGRAVQADSDSANTCAVSVDIP